MDTITLKTINRWQKQLNNYKRKLKQIAFGSFIPKRNKSKFREIKDDQFDELIDSLCNKYFSKFNTEYLKSDRFQSDLIEQLINRLQSNRLFIIPWIDNAKRLDGANVLEIGCGTGSSTIALAEQGAMVTAIDIDDDSIAVAKKRCEIYGLHANFLIQDAIDINNKKTDPRFDMIIYYATLEHMTTEERSVSLKKAWELLPRGGLLIITSTPNRLWFYDSHTSLLPFYHWLPDDIALQYARFSSRENFRSDFPFPEMSDLMQFLRWGRGFSFHELELAIKPLNELKILSSLSSYRKRKYPFACICMDFLREYRAKHQYTKVLSKIYPYIHRAFFQENIDIIVEK